MHTSDRSLLTAIDGGYCVSDNHPPCSFDKTLTGQVIPRSVQNSNLSQFKTCHTMYLQNGDKCEVGQFVISKDPDRLGATVVGHVEEILQLKGSVADFSAMPDHILLQAADVRRPAVTYQMPHIDLMNRWGLVGFQVCKTSSCQRLTLLNKTMYIQDILCTVNVQHNCGTENTCVVCQEREKTSDMRPVVLHIVPQDMMLNTAQMRDAIHVQKFRQRSVSLNADDIITASAAREVLTQKELRKASESTSVPKTTGSASRRVTQPRRVATLLETSRPLASRR
jgi:hypothetical protein